MQNDVLKCDQHFQQILQFDMWNVKPSDRYDWDALRAEIKKYVEMIRVAVTIRSL